MTKYDYLVIQVTDVFLHIIHHELAARAVCIIQYCKAQRWQSHSFER